ncbi:hypothetical protein C9439_05450 [archaeon SCG-AAA382B04]|nr:hypothetical protein C9439_05450 [archaeon SCG-AAA382B04]
MELFRTPSRALEKDFEVYDHLFLTEDGFWLLESLVFEAESFHFLEKEKLFKLRKKLKEDKTPPTIMRNGDFFVLTEDGDFYCYKKRLTKDQMCTSRRATKSDVLGFSKRLRDECKEGLEIFETKRKVFGSLGPRDCEPKFLRAVPLHLSPTRWKAKNYKALILSQERSLYYVDIDLKKKRTPDSFPYPHVLHIIN